MFILLRRNPLVHEKNIRLPHQPLFHQVHMALQGNAVSMSGSQSGLCCAVAKQHSDDKRKSFVTASFEIYYILVIVQPSRRWYVSIFQDLRSAQGGGPLK